MLAAKKIKMRTQLLVFLIVLLSAHGVQCSLSYDPDDYIEVYPDPRNPEVLRGRTPLYFSLIQAMTGPLATNGTVAGVKVALDRINNDSSLLPGYSLHYTLGDARVNLDSSYLL